MAVGEQKLLQPRYMAVPLFASYKGLELALKLRTELLGETITSEEESKMFNNIHEWGSDVIVRKVNELKGFYVKTGQIISTRVDIFPRQYTEKLAITQEKLDPLPASVVKDIVRNELLQGAELSEMFSSFDDTPLGSASIAQVHRAQLRDGRLVAVKVQRPNIASKLKADIANLKAFAKVVSPSLRLDYYKVFCELERTLQGELDFFQEAQNCLKVASAVCHSPRNRPLAPPVIVPLPLPGLISKHVLVLEYVNGTSLSTLAQRGGITPGSPEAAFLGEKLWGGLSRAYANMIFGGGIVHGDPHPGNILLTPQGDVVLLDCGQVKELPPSRRTSIAGIVIAALELETIMRTTGKDTQQAVNKERKEELEKKLDDMLKGLGVEFKADASPSCAAAITLMLFGAIDTPLPGGFEQGELSPLSPLAQVFSFPPDFVLLGRASVMLRGIAKRLGLQGGGLGGPWGQAAREVLGMEGMGVSGDYMLATREAHSPPVWAVSPPHLPSPLSRPPSLFREGREGSWRDVWRLWGEGCRVGQAILRRSVASFLDSILSPRAKKRLLGLWLRWRQVKGGV
eukprot:gene25930-31315_t